MANMRCTVKFFLDQVTCPGTLHLPDRNPVFLTIFLFGRLQRSPHVYPSFPMCFTTKIKFQRLFTNAKTPEQVLEILEDETILIELRQYTKGLKGGRVLAEFEESARTFLFPTPSYIPKRNHLKRDVLLTRNDNFPIGKGLDPQFCFRTKTYIEEGPFIHDIREIPVNRSIPASVSPSAKTLPPDTPNSGEKKGSGRKKKKKKTPLRTSYVSEPAMVVEENPDESARYHCVCDCPSLDEQPECLQPWLQSLEKTKKKNNKVKPFRAGKAPKQLLSKREFSDSFKQEKKFSKKGICRYCVVPLPTCVLCNAYKTVYGPISFLAHRFKKENRKPIRVKRRPVATPSPGKEASPVYDSSRYYNSPIGVDESVLNHDGNLRPRSYSVNKYTDADVGYPPRSSTRASAMSGLMLDDREILSAPPKSRPSANLFTDHTKVENQLEAERIHDHVKDLMKRNNSALLYELSSSESITDDDDDIELEDLESDLSTSESSKKWSNKRTLATPTATSVHRDRLDERLKEIYAELYERTLHNS